MIGSIGKAVYALLKNHKTSQTAEAYMDEHNKADIAYENLTAAVFSQNCFNMS